MARFDGSDRGVLITEESARRIARAVQKVANSKRDSPGIKLRTAYDDPETLRIGRTTEKWPKGETTELELVYEDDCDDAGSGGSGGDTLEAHNLAFPVAEGVICKVALAANGCWYLVQAESCPEGGSGSGECNCPGIGGEDLTELEGYDDSKTQVLVHQEGCLKWLDTTDCDAEGS